MKNKKAQEEMVGFAVIMIIMAVIMAILLGFIARKDSNKEGVSKSYEISSFIESSLKYTSDCQDYLGFVDIQDLIIYCYNNASCQDGRNTCEVLNSTMKELINSSWNIGPGAPSKGYKINITTSSKEILSFKEGNLSRSYMGNSQDFLRSGDNYEFSLKIYN